MGFGPLEVGQRYLLSAGSLTAGGAYPVYAGMGTILIEDEETERTLVAEVERLVPIVEREQREAFQAATEAAEATPSGDSCHS